MADREQIELLQYSVNAWNQWREHHPDRRLHLRRLHLRGADLSFADLNATHVNQTVFAWVNLCVVRGLNTMIHDGPSTVNINTVQLPVGETFIHFLRGTGFPDTGLDPRKSVKPTTFICTNLISS